MPLFPFSVYAETVGGSSPIIGVNITINDYYRDYEPQNLSVSLDTDMTRWQCVSSHSTMGCQVWSSQTVSDTITNSIDGYITPSNFVANETTTYEYDFVFDKPYVGSIVISGISTTGTATYYVNGSHLIINSKNLVTTFNVSNYTLSYAPMETISALRNWNVPFESYNALFYSLREYDPYDYFSYENISYPIYSVSANKTIMGGHIAPSNNRSNWVILYIDKNVYDLNTLNQYLAFSTELSGASITLSDFSQIGLTRTSSDIFSLIKFTVNCSSNTWFYISAKQAIKYIPIYLNYHSYQPSTDFAIVYGLSNKLLDNLNIIAQGTAQSNSSSNDLEDSANDIVQNSSTMFNFENQQNTNMNNALQSINTNFDIGSIGSSFLTSAAWVKTQFDNLTNTTPFGSVLSFSLLLGLALLIIGKVYK